MRHLFIDMLTWKCPREHASGDIKEVLGSRVQGNDHSRAHGLETNGLQMVLETS